MWQALTSVQKRLLLSTVAIDKCSGKKYNGNINLEKTHLYKRALRNPSFTSKLSWDFRLITYREPWIIGTDEPGTRINH